MEGVGKVLEEKLKSLIPMSIEAVPPLYPLLLLLSCTK